MLLERDIERNNRISFSDAFFDVAFFLYMCANLAHQQVSNAFDGNFRNYSFYLLLISIVLLFLFNRKLKLYKGTTTLIIFFLYVGLSMLWSTDPSLFNGISGQMLRNLILIIGISNRVKSKSDLDRILIIFLYAIIYCVTILIIRTPITIYGTKRIGNVLGLNENGLGIRMFFGLSIAIYFINGPLLQSKIKKFSLYILCSILIILAFFTGSRKSAFACIFLLSVSLLFTVHKRKLLFRFITFIALISLIYYIVFSVDDVYNVLGKRFDMLLQYRSGDYSSDSSSYIRSILAMEAWKVFLQHPILGCGANNFVLYNSYGVYSHNNFYEILSTLGSIGFIIYYSYYFQIVIPLWKNRKKDPQISIMLYSVLIFVICEMGLVSYFGSVYQVFLYLVYLFGHLDNKYVILQKEQLNEV